MASIKCMKCGATLKTANPVAPGKKMKCPKCAKVFIVEDEDEAGDEEVTSKRDTKSRKESVESKKSPLILIVAGGTLVVLLGCIICGGAGFFFRDRLGFGGSVAKDGGNDGKAGTALFGGDKITCDTETFFKELRTTKAKKPDIDKLVGKPFELTGTVETVEPPYFYLKGELAYRFEIKPTSGNTDKAMRLGLGQKVKVEGKCTGNNEFGFQIGPCTITELEPSKAVVTTADLVTADFSKEAKAAEGKYSAGAVVSGKIAKVNLREDIAGGKSIDFVFLDAGLKIGIARAHGTRPEYFSLQPGQQVQFRCTPKSFPGGAFITDGMLIGTGK